MRHRASSSRGASGCKKPAACQRADFRAAEAFEQRHAAFPIRTAGGFGADQYKPGGMGRMAGGVGQRNHAAERRAEHDRIDDAERVAECAHVVAPLRQIPALARAVLATAVAAVIEIDDLGDVGQSRVGGPVDRMVGAGSAMQHQQHRLFPHHRPIGDKLRALDIEEQPHPVHGYVHEQALPRFVNAPPGPTACLEADTKPYRNAASRIGNASHIFGVLRSLNVFRFRLSRRFRRQAKMSSRFLNAAGAAAIAAMLALSAQTRPHRSRSRGSVPPQGSPQVPGAVR